MNVDFLSPVNNTVVANILAQSNTSLGATVRVFTENDGFPDLSGVRLAIVGVAEGRGSEQTHCEEGLYRIRKALYALYPGKWHAPIADIGTVKQGNTVEDTYFAVRTILTALLKRNIIPILIGGSQDLTYANYRAYDSLEQTVNLVAVDSRFDLGKGEQVRLSQSFLSRIIMEEPNNLFNYSNIGYQTYFNSQEEINLLDKLYFDAYRLGQVKDITLVEPIMRDADIVSFDIGSIRQSDAPGNAQGAPNGFHGEEACAIARYAGISDKVTSFGVYEYSSALDRNDQTAQLIAQMIWYFIEGVNYRANDYPYATKESYEKYTVVLEDDDPMNFYKSDKSGRWWMEINLISNNKHKRHALIPCSYRDYEQALSHKIPERWFKALQKLA
jgi:arginase family enzyme